MELVHSVVRSLPLRPEATSLWLKKKRPLRELCLSQKQANGAHIHLVWVDGGVDDHLDSTLELAVPVITA